MKPAPKQRIELPEESTSVKAYEVEKHLRHFCQSASEELSVVLGSLSGELEHALLSEENGAPEKAIETGLKTLERLSLLARNLRYFATQTRLDTHATDISFSLLNVLDLFEKELEQKNIQVAAFVESGLYLRADPLALSQVFFNLFKNASDSIANGGKLTVSLSKNQTTLEVCISDTGTGFSEKEIEFLFEPSHIKSVGLGLHVCKVLTEAHGGDIVVRTAKGKGTNFILRFPYDPTIPKNESYLEKRRFRRIPVSLSAEVSTESGNVKSQLTTLSTGGCFLKMPYSQNLPKDETTVSVRIFLQNNSSIEIPKARVVASHPKGMDLGLGLEFTEIGAKAKRILSAIVKSHGA